MILTNLYENVVHKNIYFMKRFICLGLSQNNNKVLENKRNSLEEIYRIEEIVGVIC